MAKENISPYEVITTALELIALALEELKEEQEKTASVKVIISEP